MGYWIDGTGMEQAGQVGFVVERSNAIRRSESTLLQDDPPRTNQSHEPRLTGWCGTTNDVAVYGRGMARVLRCSRSGQRVYVESLEGEELAAALDEAGYPELAP